MSAWNHVLWTDWLINIKHGFKIRRELSDFGFIVDYEIVSGGTVYRTIGIGRLSRTNSTSWVVMLGGTMIRTFQNYYKYYR